MYTTALTTAERVKNELNKQNNVLHDFCSTEQKYIKL